MGLVSRHTVRETPSILNFFIGLGLISACAFGPGSAAWGQSVYTDKAPLVRSLPNGMTVVVLPTDSSRATVQVFVKAGSVDEPRGLSGVAAVMKTLMFAGTPAHPSGDLAHLLVVSGGTARATITRDFAFYTEEFSPDELPDILSMEADRLHNLSIDTATFLSAKARALARARRRESDSMRLIWAINRAAFSGYSYANPFFGTPKSIQALTLPETLRFYRTHYTPLNTVVVIRSSLPPGTVLRLAAQRLGTVPAGDGWASAVQGPKVGPVPVAACAPLCAQKTHQIARPRAEVQISGDRAFTVAGFIVPNFHDEKASATLAVLTQLLSGATHYGGLLPGGHQTFGLKAKGDPLVRGEGLLFVYCDRKKPGRGPLRQRLDIALGALREFPVDPRDLRAAKQRAMVALRRQVPPWLMEPGLVVALGAEKYGTTRKSLIRAVTEDDIRQMALTWLVPAHEIIGAVQPRKTRR